MLLEPHSLYPNLSINKLKVIIQTERELPLSFYLGSTWRGILGWQLKQLICPFSIRKDCQACLITEQCPYYLLLEKEETGPPGVFDVPRGYIFYAPRQRFRHELVLEISLFGYCCKFLPALIQALALAQQQGLGKERTQFSIKEIQETIPGQTPSNFDLGQDILKQVQGPFSISDWLGVDELRENQIYELKIKTPLRLRRKGKYLNSLDFPFFFSSIARRLEALSAIFEEQEHLGKERWQSLQGQFASLDKLTRVNGQISYTYDPESYVEDVVWRDFKRYSNRQRKKVPMGGIVGNVQINTSQPWFGPWLKTAELIHVGKGAAMGLGRIEVK